MNVLHNLELGFDKISASAGYLEAKRIHDIRECRRRAKDKLEVISLIEELLSREAFTEMEELPNKLKNRQYHNRNNGGMFDFEKVENLSDLVDLNSENI